MGRFLIVAACIVAIMMATAPASVAKAAHGCNVLHARYAAAGESQYTLSFARLALSEQSVSDIGLRIDFKPSGRVLWYYFDQGSAPRVALISTDDFTRSNWRVVPDGGVRPYGSATFIGVGPVGNILQDAPTSSSNAPAAIIIPELAQALNGQEPDYKPSSFKLQSCSQRPPN